MKIYFLTLQQALAVKEYYEPMIIGNPFDPSKESEWVIDRVELVTENISDYNIIVSSHNADSEEYHFGLKKVMVAKYIFQYLEEAGIEVNLEKFGIEL